MLITAPSRQTPTFTRLRASVVQDSYGDPVQSWASPSRSLIKRGDWGAVKVNSETETATADEQANTRAFSAPGDIGLRADDRVEVNDGGVIEIWRVDAQPTVYRTLALGTFTSAILRRFERTKEVLPDG